MHGTLWHCSLYRSYNNLLTIPSTEMKSQQCMTKGSQLTENLFADTNRPSNSDSKSKHMFLFLYLKISLFAVCMILSSKTARSPRMNPRHSGTKTRLPHRFDIEHWSASLSLSFCLLMLITHIQTWSTMLRKKNSKQNNWRRALRNRLTVPISKMLFGIFESMSLPILADIWKMFRCSTTRHCGPRWSQTRSTLPAYCETTGTPFLLEIFT